MTLTSLAMLFAVKFVDKFLGTTRNILLIKGKSLSSAVFDSMRFMMLIIVTKKMIEVTSIWEYLVLAAAVFCGNVIGKSSTKRFEKDSQWLHIIQIKDRDVAKNAFDSIREGGLQVITHNSYNDYLDQTLSATIKTSSKEESRILSRNLMDVEYEEITLNSVVN